MEKIILCYYKLNIHMIVIYLLWHNIKAASSYKSSIGNNDRWRMNLCRNKLDALLFDNNRSYIIKAVNKWFSRIELWKHNNFHLRRRLWWASIVNYIMACVFIVLSAWDYISFSLECVFKTLSNLIVLIFNIILKILIETISKNDWLLFL